MQAYIAKRLLLFIPTLLLITIMVFALMRVLPGDPALLLLVGTRGRTVHPGTARDTAGQAGHRPERRRSVHRLGMGHVRLDFGISMFYDTAISDDIKKKLPITLELTVLGMLLAVGFALPLGVLFRGEAGFYYRLCGQVCSHWRGSAAYLWVGIMMIFFLVKFFGWLPPLGYVDLWDDPLKNLQQIIFPAIALGIYNMAFIARVTRFINVGSVPGGLHQDRPVQGSGRDGSHNPAHPSETHCCLWSLSPAGSLPACSGGTVIIETIFLVPGWAGC